MYYAVLLVPVLTKLYFYFSSHSKSNRFSRLWKRHFLPFSPSSQAPWCHLLQQSAPLLIKPIYHGLVGKILEAGGGKEGARVPYLKVFLSPCQSFQPLKDNKFPLPGPSPLCLLRGYTLLTHYSLDNQKVGNFKWPGLGIFLLSSQQAGEIVTRGGRRDQSCRHFNLLLVLKFDIESWHLKFPDSAARSLSFLVTFFLS